MAGVRPGSGTDGGACGPAEDDGSIANFAFLKQWVTHNLTADYVNLSFKLTSLKQLATRNLRQAECFGQCCEEASACARQSLSMSSL